MSDIVTDTLTSLGIPPKTLARAITRVEVHTAYGPPIVLDDPFAPGPPNPYLQALKPEVVLYVGDTPVTAAPYGEPGPTKWPQVRTAAWIGAFAGLAGLVYWATR